MARVGAAQAADVVGVGARALVGCIARSARTTGGAAQTLAVGHGEVGRRSAVATTVLLGGRDQSQESAALGGVVVGGACVEDTVFARGLETIRCTVSVGWLCSAGVDARRGDATEVLEWALVGGAAAHVRVEMLGAEDTQVGSAPGAVHEVVKVIKKPAVVESLGLADDANVEIGTPVLMGRVVVDRLGVSALVRDVTLADPAEEVGCQRGVEVGEGGVVAKMRVQSAVATPERQLVGATHVVGGQGVGQEVVESVDGVEGGALHRVVEHGATGVSDLPGTRELGQVRVERVRGDGIHGGTSRLRVTGVDVPTQLGEHTLHMGLEAATNDAGAGELGAPLQSFRLDAGLVQLGLVLRLRHGGERQRVRVCGYVPTRTCASGCVCIRERQPAHGALAQAVMCRSERAYGLTLNARGLLTLTSVAGAQARVCVRVGDACACERARSVETRPAMGTAKDRSHNPV